MKLLLPVFCVCFALSASAVPLGSPLLLGSSVSPGPVVTGALDIKDSTTLVIDRTAPYSGPNNWALVSAVILRADGQVDYYYQITNGADSPYTFSGFSVPRLAASLTTSVGYRTDGQSVLPGTINWNPQPPYSPSFNYGGAFTDGGVIPTLAHRDDTGVNLSSATFDFTLAPGQTSAVLVLSTNQTWWNSKGGVSMVDPNGTTPWWHLALRPGPFNHSVPDSGLTGLLFAAALSCLCFMRRKWVF